MHIHTDNRFGADISDRFTHLPLEHIGLTPDTPESQIPTLFADGAGVGLRLPAATYDLLELARQKPLPCKFAAYEARACLLGDTYITIARYFGPDAYRELGELVSWITSQIAAGKKTYTPDLSPIDIEP